MYRFLYAILFLAVEVRKREADSYLGTHSANHTDYSRTP